MEGSIRLTKTKGSDSVTRKTKKRPSSSRLPKIIPQLQPTALSAARLYQLTNHQLYHVYIKKTQEDRHKVNSFIRCHFLADVTEGYGTRI